MLRDDWRKDAVLLYIVVNHGMASRVMNFAKEQGITGATVTLGKGTVQNKILNALGVNDSRKEIVMMAADRPTGLQVLDTIATQFRFDRPGKGIGFALRIPGFAGAKVAAHWPQSDDSAIQPPQWQLITVIVDRDRAEEAVEFAQAAGARGGTLIRGRGSGVAQTQKLFDIEIEPEKAVYFILSPASVAPQLEQALDSDLQLSRPNSGILFTQNLIAVRGLYQSDSQPGSTPEAAETLPQQPREDANPSADEESPDYLAIYTVVDKGRAEEVIDAAVAAGSYGGTIINGRGSGVHETERLFGMGVEPEKETVMILAQRQAVCDITESIYTHLELDQPGGGVIFVEDVARVRGIYQPKL